MKINFLRYTQAFIVNRYSTNHSSLFQRKSRISKIIRTTISLALLSSIVLNSQVQAAGDDVVNVYSARKEALILPLLEQFQQETGIEYNLITGKADALLKRIEAEGEATPADVFITVDAGRLERAKSAGILQPLKVEVIEQIVPENLRDEDNQWVGLSKRARVIFYNPAKINPVELSTYANLADPQWKGRLCVRSSSNIYNQSLVASLIEHIGIEQTEQWAKGVVDNFARKPSGGDTDQLRAIAAGECDIAVANTYYYGRLANSDKEEDQQVVEKVALLWPDQDGKGAHVNVSGAGIVQYAKHPQSAQRLIEFLLTPESQSWYAEANNEYPVVPNVEIPETLTNLGEFQSDDINLTILGENNKSAIQVMDRAGWQ